MKLNDKELVDAVNKVRDICLSHEGCESCPLDEKYRCAITCKDVSVEYEEPNIDKLREVVGKLTDRIKELERLSNEKDALIKRMDATISEMASHVQRVSKLNRLLKEELNKRSAFSLHIIE